METPPFSLKLYKIGKHLYMLADFFVSLRSEFDFFLDKEPIVFRILLKHHIRIARMTKATKLTPYRRGH